MKVTIYIGSEKHPIIPVIENWLDCIQDDYTVDIVYSIDDISSGNILFLIACTDIIDLSIKKKYRHCLVVHASNLPKGRGWSPHVWDIINDSPNIYVSILDADEKVDSGDIWFKECIPVEKHFLYNEINKALFKSVIRGVAWSIENADCVKKLKQKELGPPSYYPRRTPDDSKLDMEKSIREQFNKLRICDPDRYPAFIEYLGCKYKITISKIID